MPYVMVRFMSGRIGARPFKPNANGLRTRRRMARSTMFAPTLIRGALSERTRGGLDMSVGARRTRGARGAVSTRGGLCAIGAHGLRGACGLVWARGGEGKLTGRSHEGAHANGPLGDCAIYRRGSGTDGLLPNAPTMPYLSNTPANSSWFGP